MPTWRRSSGRFRLPTRVFEGAGTRRAATAPPAPVIGSPLSLPRRPGRWRRWRQRALLCLAAWSGWGWLGFDGAVLLVLWWWHAGRGEDARPPTAFWVVPLDEVRSLRCGIWRTRVMLRGHRVLEIFHDELDAADLARLRRVLRRQLAAG